ncbi:hypothetical protein CRENBAI_001351 [Crenichthys baileyi]|uniref:Uncharacterized protein n=1 Tax=Crenichthys baileyi TaxID=28760 RepID=A0AAV9QVD2_9TELE
MMIYPLDMMGTIKTKNRRDHKKKLIQHMKGRCKAKACGHVQITSSLTSVSQSFSTTYSIVGRGGAGVYLQQSMGERQGAPWTGCQSIRGQHTNNHAHTHSYT